MHPVLTVIICTHNPRRSHLDATLASLKAQRPLPLSAPWELILIDNASTTPLAETVDLSWHPSAHIVREEQLGLTHARLRGFREARAEIMVCVDDDNILDADYLLQAFTAMMDDPSLGAAGGKSLPVYEVEPPAWFPALGISLACRDLGDAPIYASWADAEPDARAYPDCAPVGAGMVVRRKAYAAYVEAAGADPLRTGLGRKGADLASGEDNDMAMSFLAQGWRIAYLPQLRLEHLIPAGRLAPDYLARLAYSSNRTWVQVLDVHGIRPWGPIPAWTAPARRVKAFVRAKAWASIANRVRWRGACGLIDGRALLRRGR